MPDRHRVFDDALSADHVDLVRLQQLAMFGVPEKSGRRSLTWRLLLGHLSPDRTTWSARRHKTRLLYQQYLDELVVEGQSSTELDHPLNTDPASSWTSFFKQNEVLAQIDKDVRRLCPYISFFAQKTTRDVGSNDLNRILRQRVLSFEQQLSTSWTLQSRGFGSTRLMANSSARRQHSYDDGLDSCATCFPSDSKGKSVQSLTCDCERHWQVVERILFVFARLNPGIGYVQGMNEIAGHLYYVLAADVSDTDDWPEADTFFCFTRLMSEIGDNFVQSNDNSCISGVRSCLAKFRSLLRQVDASLDHRLEVQKVLPEYYAFRWITLLLCHEFELPDTLRLWDSILAAGDGRRIDFAIYIGISMLLIVKSDVMSKDFVFIMKMLQNYPPTDVAMLVTKAIEVMNYVNMNI